MAFGRVVSSFSGATVTVRPIGPSFSGAVCGIMASFPVTSVSFWGDLPRLGCLDLFRRSGAADMVPFFKTEASFCALSVTE